MSLQNVSYECLKGMSQNKISSECLIRMSYHKFLLKNLIKKSHQKAASNCLMKMSHKNASSICLIKTFGATTIGIPVSRYPGGSAAGDHTPLGFFSSILQTQLFGSIKPQNKLCLKLEVLILHYFQYK